VVRFTKPATTLDQQFESLRLRGMSGDEAEIKRHLSRTNYYRLAAYAFTFRSYDRVTGNRSDSYIPWLMVPDQKVRTAGFIRPPQEQRTCAACADLGMPHVLGAFWCSLRWRPPRWERRHASAQSHAFGTQTPHSVLQPVHVQHHHCSREPQVAGTDPLGTTQAWYPKMKVHCPGSGLAGPPPPVPPPMEPPPAEPQAASTQACQTSST